MDFQIVEYLDELTGKPTGQYARRFKDGFEAITDERFIVNPQTGAIESVITSMQIPKFRDDLIPVRYIAVVDSTGKIIALSEVKISYSVENGGNFYSDIPDGASEVILQGLPVLPAPVTEDGKLSYILDNFKALRSQPADPWLLVPRGGTP